MNIAFAFVYIVAFVSRIRLFRAVELRRMSVLGEMRKYEEL